MTVFGQLAKASNAASSTWMPEPAGSSVESRGVTNTVTFSCPFSGSRPAGIAVKTARSVVISHSLDGEGAAVLGPRVMGRTEGVGVRPHRVQECRVAARPGELLLARHAHRERQEAHRHLDRDRRLADRLGARRPVGCGDRPVAQLEVQLDRRRDEPEHVDLAPRAEVAGELHALRVTVHLEAEVDARHDRQAPGCHDEAHLDGGAELERRLDDLQALRRDRDGEEPAAGEERDLQTERVLAGGEEEAELE